MFPTEASAQKMGHVGIGTTSPLNQLTVGTSSSNDTTSIAHFSGPVGIWPTADNAWANSRASLMLARNSDNYLMMTQPNANTAGIGLSGTGNNLMFVNQNGPIQFKTGVTFSGDWNATGNVGLQFSTNGNVGVGTTSPASRLHIVDTNANTGFLYESGNTATINNYTELKMRTYNQAVINAEYTAIRGITESVTPGGRLTGLGFYYGNQATGLTEGMRISGNGNVGTDTANPANILRLTAQYLAVHHSQTPMQQG